jgi:hypothetical protein
MRMKVAAAANALQGLLASLTKISFTAARTSPAHAGFFSTFFARALTISVSAATFQPVLTRQARISLSGRLANFLATGYGSGGYSTGEPYGSSTAPQILVLKTIAAQTATVTVSFVTKFIVALVFFAASGAKALVGFFITTAVSFIAAAFSASGYGLGGYGVPAYGSGGTAPTGLKGFLYGLIRKIRVHGGR